MYPQITGKKVDFIIILLFEFVKWKFFEKVCNYVTRDWSKCQSQGDGLKSTKALKIVKINFGIVSAKFLHKFSTRFYCFLFYWSVFLLLNKFSYWFYNIFGIMDVESIEFQVFFSHLFWISIIFCGFWRKNPRFKEILRSALMENFLIGVYFNFWEI